MPDITMCNDAECPFRDTCYRYTAPPNGWRQAWFTSSPRNGDCDYYWPTKKDNSE